LLDEMLHGAVAVALGEFGHDATHVRDHGLSATDDAVILAFACDNDLALVTANLRDYRPLHRERIDAGIAVCPLLLITQARINALGPAQARPVAALLDGWAARHPAPYRGEHWLG
jgi:hypothetical protein